MPMLTCSSLSTTSLITAVVLHSNHRLWHLAENESVKRKGTLRCPAQHPVCQPLSPPQPQLATAAALNLHARSSPSLLSFAFLRTRPHTIPAASAWLEKLYSPAPYLRDSPTVMWVKLRNVSSPGLYLVNQERWMKAADPLGAICT